MPFLEHQDGYLHDVFVSYAHADVEAAGDSHIKRWCQQFGEELRKEIAAELRRDQPTSQIVSMFLDESARPDASIDPSLPLSGQLDQATRIRAAARAYVSLLPQHALVSQRNPVLGKCADQEG